MGVGERAFPRFGPGLVLRDYRILCYLRTQDLSEIRAVVPVDCLEERLQGSSQPCRDTVSLLSHPALRRSDTMPPYGAKLFIYRDTPELRALASEKGWILLANPFPVRMRWENKAWFRSRLRQAGLPAAQGVVVPVEGLCDGLFRELRERWREGLVIQVPDFPRGGGRATHFIRDEAQLDEVRRRWVCGTHRGHNFKEVLISPWIEGPSLSMEGCVTTSGVLLSPLQTQLVDIPEVLPEGRMGRFCGHQWGVPEYPAEVGESARKVCRWVGEALRKEGYLGIFGLDFALDRRSGTLYALECNPRYTGAFPVLTLLQAAAGLPPLEAFHVLSWLQGEVSFPVEGLNRAFMEMPAASQLLLFHKGERSARVEGSLEGGTYRWSEATGTAFRKGPAFPLAPPPWDPEEFLILDGPPAMGTELLPGEALDRVLRLVFFRPVLLESGELDPFAVRVIRWTYGSLGLPEGKAPNS